MAAQIVVLVYQVAAVLLVALTFFGIKSCMLCAKLYVARRWNRCGMCAVADVARTNVARRRGGRAEKSIQQQPQQQEQQQFQLPAQKPNQLANMGNSNAHAHAHKGITPNSATSVEKSPSSTSLMRHAGGERRASRVHVLSRLVSQKRIRETFLSAAATSMDGSGQRAAAPEVNRAQLNASEQIDFHPHTPASSIEIAIALPEAPNLYFHADPELRQRLHRAAKERPLSEISLTSGDTLSPGTARAVAELQRRWRSDKLAGLSISRVEHLHIAPNDLAEQPQPLEIAVEATPESSPDERMALQLGKKLAQVLGTGGNATPPAEGAAVTAPSPISNGELFNIAKAKKVELQNLSSRFAAVTQTPPAAPASPLDTGATTTETQSTVIISFKSSSQTPASSQGQAQAPAADSATDEAGEADTGGLPPPPPGYGTPTTPLLSSNVLKKVASFTAEKAAATAAATPMPATPTPTATATALASEQLSATPTAAQLEHTAAGPRRGSSYVPEKLSFAAYEKFEGQMLIKWLLSTLQGTTRMAMESAELNAMALQFCNNLKYVGVLKQISNEQQDTFSPYEMYQWTHTEQPTTSLPLTPGKLDKVAAWPFSSTPAASKTMASNVTEAVNGKALQQILRKRLLNCATLAEVHAVVNELLSSVDEPPRRPSKRCVQVTELINASESTLYEYNKTMSGGSEVSDALGKCCVDAETQTDECAGFEAMDNGDVDKATVSSNASTNAATETQTSAPAPAPAPPPPPPPPMPMSSFSGPPAPPPPPPPAFNNAPVPVPPPPPLAPINAAVPPPPPPASTSKSASDLSPAPLPNPTEGNWFLRTNTLRKSAVNPPKPMRPLYWTRIVTCAPRPPSVANSTDSTDNSVSSPDEPVTASSSAASTPGAGAAQPTKEIWTEIEETPLDNIDEFTELFSRQAVVPISRPKEPKTKSFKFIKVLDPNRSKNVGIFSRSLHVPAREIEHAIYYVDTSVVSLETLQQISHIKATEDELQRIKEAVAGSDLPLDSPEQFLLDLSLISMATERISCIVFQVDFEESCTLLVRKLETVSQLSQHLIESEDLKLVFSIILTLGNYMNGGNRQRGQADGFTLDILGKLKDVKSKESHTTLLHFIVRTYIAQRRKEGVNPWEIRLPIPEPADVERAAQLDFDKVKQQIIELDGKLNTCKKTSEEVLSASNAQGLEPFKSKMEDFIVNAETSMIKLDQRLEECRNVFLETTRFYHFVSKTSSKTQAHCTPDEFFECWTNFTNDFKDIWKKEIATLLNDLLKKSKQLQHETRRAPAVKVPPNKLSLKERMLLRRGKNQ